jgi:hypothetical protein
MEVFCTFEAEVWMDERTWERKECNELQSNWSERSSMSEKVSGIKFEIFYGVSSSVHNTIATRAIRQF